MNQNRSFSLIIRIRQCSRVVQNARQFHTQRSINRATAVKYRSKSVRHATKAQAVEAQRGPALKLGETNYQTPADGAAAVILGLPRGEDSRDLGALLTVHTTTTQKPQHEHHDYHHHHHHNHRHRPSKRPTKRPLYIEDCDEDDDEDCYDYYPHPAPWYPPPPHHQNHIPHPPNYAPQPPQYSPQPPQYSSQQPPNYGPQSPYYGFQSPYYGPQLPNYGTPPYYPSPSFYPFPYYYPPISYIYNQTDLLLIEHDFA
ncbi:unnamed protein product [Ceratitis capitata]|uniref:(Mediterranean fruit fly) hypothetical protein n=1 Tax=Ceratitis capitata TaxID=7213 RepID=A0A811VGF0_CERCA|nr:unnamed protein product [Ceratitis capitata]